MGALKFFLQRSFMMRRIHLARSQIFEWQSFVMNVVASLGDIHHKVTQKFLIGSAEVFMMSSELLSDNNLSYRMNELYSCSRYVPLRKALSDYFASPKERHSLLRPQLSFVRPSSTNHFYSVACRCDTSRKGFVALKSTLPHFLNIRKT